MNVCINCRAQIKMKPRKVEEKDIAAAVVEWLEQQGFEVYQEVSTGYASRRADIVAVKDDRKWIIETKTSFSLDLLEQVYQWARHKSAHRVSVAILRRCDHKRRRSEERQIDSVLLRHFGIGLIHCNVYHQTSIKLHIDIEEMIEPADIQVDPWFEIKPHEGHKECAEAGAKAGSAGGGYWTPFKQTCDNLREYMKQHDGCRIMEAVKGIEHHYSSDRSAAGNLREMIARGIVQGLKLERKGNAFHIFVCEDETGQQSLL